MQPDLDFIQRLSEENTERILLRWYNIVGEDIALSAFLTAPELVRCTYDTKRIQNRLFEMTLKGRLD